MTIIEAKIVCIYEFADNYGYNVEEVIEMLKEKK